MAERIVPTDPQEIDSALLARLLLGAQSEHEQRLVVIRLLSRDAEFRAAVASVVEPFEMFDLDDVSEYAAVLRQGRGDEAEQRRRILRRAYARADLEHMLRHFTYTDVLSLGEVTRQLFSWSMAELLIDRSRRTGLADYGAATSLYLALMVIDVVEILGAAGHSPTFPEVVCDVRKRITDASKTLGNRDDPTPERSS